jgi:hypothetical protein
MLQVMVDQVEAEMGVKVRHLQELKLVKQIQVGEVAEVLTNQTLVGQVEVVL